MLVLLYVCHFSAVGDFAFDYLPPYIIIVGCGKCQNAPYFFRVEVMNMKTLPHLHEPDLPLIDSRGSIAIKVSAENVPRRNDSHLRKAIIVPMASRINISWISRWTEIEHYIYDTTVTSSRTDTDKHQSSKAATAVINSPKNKANPVDKRRSYYVPVNKGNEAMAYLSFIIDHYDDLPDRMLFLHGHYKSWHQPHIDGLLSHLRWEFEGYHNLKCITEAKLDMATCKPGVNPLTSPKTSTGVPGFVDYWKSVMAPNGFGAMPKWVAAPCCAQFIVSKTVVLKNDRKIYSAIRDWIIQLSQNDSSLAGFVLEQSWHIIFTRKHVLCPPSKSCYCTLYGLCDSKATS